MYNLLNIRINLLTIDKLLSCNLLYAASPYHYCNSSVLSKPNLLDLNKELGQLHFDILILNIYA